MAAERKEDRRIQRTRTLLRDALMALIAERGYEHIGVQDITDRANVARTTFYLHYSDKDDLLFSSMRETYEQLLHSFQRHNSFAALFASPQTEHQADASDFEHVRDYAEFYRIMLSENGSMAFLTRVRDYLAAIISQHILTDLPAHVKLNMPVEALGYAYAGMEIGLVAWWLKQSNPPTPQQMATWLEELCFFGLAKDLPARPE